MKKMNIQRDLDSRAAIAGAAVRPLPLAHESEVEPENEKTDGKSEDLPERADHEESGAAESGQPKKVRKTKRDV